MTDRPIQHTDEDGSIYAAELVPPEADDAKYRVDLVRASTDDDGADRQQRLTVAQYDSLMEAEEHLHEVADGLAQNGLAALGDDVGRLREQPFERDVFHVTAVYPPDAGGNDRATAQLLAVGESDITTAPLAAGERDDVESVVNRVDAAFAEAGRDAGLALARQEAGTALFDRDDGAVRHVDGGGTAHWFAVVPNDEPEADPYELRYFRSLEMDDGTQRADSYPVMPLPDDDPASAWPLRGLEMYLEKGDVYMVQQIAHDVADAYGADFPEPHDLPALDPRPEYYFGYGVGENNQPSLEVVKTWMDGAERRFDTLTINEYDSYEDAAVDEYILDTALATDGVEYALNIAERWSEANGYLDPQRDDPRIFFEDDAPDDPFTTHREREMPQYQVGAISANGEHFIDVIKSWGDDEYERLTIPQPTWEDAQLAAEMAFTDQQNGDLQGAMRRIESLAEDAGVLDPQRDDPRLFRQGPPDRFETLAQHLAGESVSLPEPEDYIYRVEFDDSANMDFVPREAAENPYWRMETLPVNDPDGESLGHALHMVVYPHVEHDPERVGTPAMAADEPFRMLEMAHFETTSAADKFGKEFNGYLMPGVLEGPELAQEVARLEGLPVEWKTLEGDDLTAYQNLTLTLTRNPVDWHPYNPNAERDARIEA
ncbi:MAG: hypothetical protein EA396_15100, partial [Anaerolineaceae bacterium]